MESSEAGMAQRSCFMLGHKRQAFNFCFDWMWVTPRGNGLWWGGSLDEAILERGNGWTLFPNNIPNHWCNRPFLNGQHSSMSISRIFPSSWESSHMPLTSQFSTPTETIAQLDIYRHELVLVNLELPINGIIKSVLSLTSFSKHNVFEFHPCCVYE